MWLGDELRLGALVCENDGRHVGKLVARDSGRWKVRWLDNPTWVSYFFPDEIRRATEEECS